MRRIAGLLALTLTAALLVGCVYDPYTGTYAPCCGYYGYPYYGNPYSVPAALRPVRLSVRAIHGTAAEPTGDIASPQICSRAICTAAEPAGTYASHTVATSAICATAAEPAGIPTTTRPIAIRAGCGGLSAGGVPAGTLRRSA